MAAATTPGAASTHVMHTDGLGMGGCGRVDDSGCGLRMDVGVVDIQ